MWLRNTMGVSNHSLDNKSDLSNKKLRIWEKKIPPVMENYTVFGLTLSHNGHANECMNSSLVRIIVLLTTSSIMV
jgi:hypothetical protein